jgi:hypothetical protein
MNTTHNTKTKRVAALEVAAAAVMAPAALFVGAGTALAWPWGDNPCDGMLMDNGKCLKFPPPPPEEIEPSVKGTDHEDLPLPPWARQAFLPFTQGLFGQPPPQSEPPQIEPVPLAPPQPPVWQVGPPLDAGPPPSGSSIWPAPGSF